MNCRILFLLFLSLFTGCSGENGQDAGRKPGPLVLRMLGWAEYFPDSLRAQFEAENHCRVEYSIYDTEDEFAGRVQSSPELYDVLIGTYETLAALRLTGLLYAFDRSRMPGLGDLYADLYPLPGDPEGSHCLPYCWGGYAIAYRKSVTGDLMKDVSLPFNPLVGGKVMMSSDMQSTFLLTNQLLGMEPDDFSLATLGRAADRLRQQGQEMQVEYGSDDDFLKGMRAGTYTVAFGYTGDAWVVARENPDIGCFILPDSPMWADGIAISRDASEPALAEKMLEFLLRPAVLAQLSESVYYPTASRAAAALVDPELSGNDLLFPSEERRKAEGLTRQLTDEEFASLAACARYVHTGQRPVPLVPSPVSPPTASPRN